MEVCRLLYVTPGFKLKNSSCWLHYIYRGADTSLTQPGRKQARKHFRNARDFNNIETRAVIKFFFFFLQGKAPKEIHAILTETIACFLPGRAKECICCVWISDETVNLPYISLTEWFLQRKWKVFTARYGLSPYITH